MSKEYTQRYWTNRAVKGVEDEAKDAGILPKDARLVFGPGSPMNGVSPTVTAYDPEGRMITQPRFIPEFGFKDTAKTVEKAMNAIERTLRAVNDLTR
jgi:hypothetical protein